MDYTTAYPAYAEACRTSGVDSEEAENLRGGAVFSLVPSTGTTPSVKGRPATKAAADGFVRLTDKIPEKSQLKGTEIYHGYLLGGVPAEGGEGGQGSVTPDEPVATVQKKVIFNAGYAVKEDGTIDTATEIPGVEGVPVEFYVSVPEGSSTSVLLDAAMPTSTGSFDFMTWAKLDDSNNIIGEYASGSALIVSASDPNEIYLYGLWNSVSYELTINIDPEGKCSGGTITNANNALYQSPQTFLRGQSIGNVLKQAFTGGSAPLTFPTMRLLGWEITMNGETINLTSNSTTDIAITGDAVANGKWGPIEGTLSFAHGNVTIGTLPASITFNYGNDIPYVANNYYEVGDTASASGKDYVFKGWQLYKAGESTALTNTLFAASANIPSTWAFSDLVLKSVWEEKATAQQITINFYDTWNEQTINGGTASILVTEGKISYDSSWSFIPAYWVQGSTTTVTVTNNTATFNGDRHNYSVSGDSGKDYQVLTTVAGLNKVNSNKSNLSKNYWMLNDITTDSALEAGLGDFGDSVVEFTGVFNGNGKKLNEFFLQKDDSHIALFCRVAGTVRNLNVDASGGVQGNTYVGVITGQNRGLIENCNVSGYMIIGQTNSSNNGRVGGIAGLNDSNGIIRNCSVTGVDVVGYYYVGGIAGENKGQIISSTFSASVNATYDITSYYIGGIAGSNSGTIDGCTTSCDSSGVNGSYDVGGIVGLNSNIVKNSIVSGSATYEICGYSRVGAVVGKNTGTIEQTHCPKKLYVLGTSTTTQTTTGSKSGGFVGENAGGTIRNCGTYATGCGFYMVGGFVGNLESGTITGCFTTGGCNKRSMTTAAQSQNVGGFCGRMNGGTIENSYNMTLSNIYAYNIVGGFCGNMRAGTIRNCYSRVANVGYVSNATYYTFGVGARASGASVVKSYLMTTNSITTAWLGSFTARGNEATFMKFDFAAQGWSADIWDFGTNSQLPIIKGINSDMIRQPRSASDLLNM